MTEIEMKARVSDPEATACRIGEFALFTGETRKRDVYWTQGERADGTALKVRIRDEDGALTVTYKRKEVRGTLEVNDEREFRIDCREAFECLLADAGFQPTDKKEKSTRRWSLARRDAASPEEKAEIGIELSHVAGLGWFLELEALADAPSDAEIERTRVMLLDLLGRCGIDESKLEGRHYTEMLREAEGGEASRT